jgi:peptide/nickel transport system substrate-binding protein
LTVGPLARGATLLAAAAAVLVAGGWSGRGSTVSARRDTTTLRVGTIATLDSLNPFVAIQDISSAVRNQIYPKLVELGPTGSAIPDLAPSWKSSNGGRVFTFHLRKGSWSDGQAITSADVAWTINTVLKFGKGPAGNLASAVTGIKSVGTPDPETVVVTYSTPEGQALVNLADLDILPQHVWEQYATGDGKALQTFTNSSPVTGGPFTVAQYQQGSVLLLQRNPTFYGSAPKVDRIGFEFFSNADALVAALKTHQIDAAEDIPAAAVNGLKASGLVVTTSPGLVQLMLGINSYLKRSTHAELRNPSVRQAFDLAIDRAQIVKTAYLGLAQSGRAMVPSALGAAHAALPPTRYNPTRANALLDGLGFKRGAGGIRLANGHRMSYVVIELNDSGGGAGPAMEIMARDFAKIGVKLNVKVLDAPAAVALIFGHKGNYAGADMELASLSGGMDPAYILSYNTCSALGIYNLPGWCDHQYQSLYDKQAQTVNALQRRGMIRQMQAVLDRGKPYLVVDYADEITAHSPSWSGFADSPIGWFINKKTSTHVHAG